VRYRRRSQSLSRRAFLDVPGALWVHETTRLQGRPTNAFSRKVENLAAAASLHFIYYNFARPAYMSLANPYPRSPAMAAGATDHVWKIDEIVALLV
jgi:hypothetical protein